MTETIYCNLIFKSPYLRASQRRPVVFNPKPLCPASRESTRANILVWSSDLSWSQHINNVCVLKPGNFLALSMFVFTTPESLFQMYISIVHLSLEYAIQNWCSQLDRVCKFVLHNVHMCTNRWDYLLPRVYYNCCRCSPCQIFSNTGLHYSFLEFIAFFCN